MYSISTQRIPQIWMLVLHIENVTTLEILEQSINQ